MARCQSLQPPTRSPYLQANICWQGSVIIAEKAHRMPRAGGNTELISACYAHNTHTLTHAMHVHAMHTHKHSEIYTHTHIHTQTHTHSHTHTCPVHSRKSSSWVQSVALLSGGPRAAGCVLGGLEKVGAASRPTRAQAVALMFHHYSCFQSCARLLQ